MKVFVTGAEGFVGKRLVSRLREKSYEVVAVDMAVMQGSSTIKADIRLAQIGDLIPESADAIIHLAGVTRNPECQNKAYNCFDNNVMATLNLIDAAQAKKVKQFIFASSEWVYGDWKDASIVKDEGSVINPHELNSEYAFSKLVSEVNLKQKFQYGFCSTTILRFGIIYGPREKSGSAVESIFNAVKTQQEVQVGSLKTGRCFIHVEDIITGIMASLGLQGLNIINLQGEHLITLGDIIETSKKITGRNPTVSELDPANISLRRVSNEKAKELLKWKPSFDLNTGLESLL